MHRFRWFRPLVIVAFLGTSLLSVAAAPIPVGAPEIAATAEHGREVQPGVRLWVHVFPAGNGHPARPSAAPGCTDDNSQSAYTLFAKANSTGLRFNLNTAGVPSTVGAVSFDQAMRSALGRWDAATNLSYFTVNSSGGASGPALDGNNTIGWARLVPKNVLAATWTWQDSEGRVLESDMFFNTIHPWAVLSACGGRSFDVENVAVHEAGHTLGIDHTSDSAAEATMYPSAPAGEIKKRTLTAGDISGLAAALR